MNDLILGAETINYYFYAKRVIISYNLRTCHAVVTRDPPNMESISTAIHKFLTTFFILFLS